MCTLKLNSSGRMEHILDKIMLPLPQIAVTASKIDEELLATHGKTFHFAARFLPPELRPAVVLLYAFFRTLDDLVDEPVPGRQVEDVCAELEAWKSWFISKYAFPAPRERLGAALHCMLNKHPVPTPIFLDFLNGLIADLEAQEITDFSELYHYCYQVAGTVGLAMAYVLGVRSAPALTAAKNLGIAMQLTNILRDVGEDLVANRVYLPRDELESFGCPRTHLLKLYEARQKPDDHFRSLMRFQVKRTHYYYKTGMPGIWLLPPDCRLPILIAARLYRRILIAIERNQYDVLHSRATTSFGEKIYEASTALMLDRLWRSREIWTTSEMEVLFEKELSLLDPHHNPGHTGHTRV